MDKSIKVKQSTVDSMRQMGMTKALEKANSGSADSEFMEAAKRFYGNRVKKQALKIPTMKQEPKQMRAKDEGHVIGEAATKTTLSKKGSQIRKMA